MKAKRPVPPPPAPVDPFAEVETSYLSNPIHAAYESGAFCANCGTPVQRDWPRCPVCGSTKMRTTAPDEHLTLNERIARFRPKPPEPDTVEVTEVK